VLVCPPALAEDERLDHHLDFQVGVVGALFGGGLRLRVQALHGEDFREGLQPFEQAHGIPELAAQLDFEQLLVVGFGRLLGLTAVGAAVGVGGRQFHGRRLRANGDNLQVQLAHGLLELLEHRGHIRGLADPALQKLQVALGGLQFVLNLLELAGGLLRLLQFLLLLLQAGMVPLRHAPGQVEAGCAQREGRCSEQRGHLRGALQALQAFANCHFALLAGWIASAPCP